MIVFILSLFSSGHKLRISSLYQLLWENERLQYLFMDLPTNFCLSITVFQN